MSAEEKPVRRQPAWRLAWRRFRSYRLGMAGLAIVVFLLVVAFLAPLLANEQPMLCRFDPSIHAPAVIDTLHNIPGASLVIQKRRPFRLATFDFKSEFDPGRGDWALWTLVPFGPRESIADSLDGPSPVHWLGTDQSGRDVLSRMIHGAGVSMRVGFLSMGIAGVIGIVLGSIAG
jgi:ABC-type microcin C transport system permease subunit YejE